MEKVMLPQPKVVSLDPGNLKTICSTCSLHELCLPAELSQEELDMFDRVFDRRRPVKRGDYLYRAGSALHSLFAIRAGFVKSSVMHEDGREQVAGFHMTGDLLGLDGISTNQHTCDTVALEDSELCEIPFLSLEKLSRELPALQHHFHRMMSREIVRDHGVMLLLGSMRAEERLAAFLISLSQRFAVRGYSPTEFHLRMTREEVGSYLGLKLETISRVLSRFQEEGLLEVRNKHIKIMMLEQLRELASQRGGAT